jgi:hypothetical protein
MEYKTISAKSIQDLDSFVTSALNEGWRPHGGSTTVVEQPVWFSQTVVRGQDPTIGRLIYAIERLTAATRGM